MSTTHRFARLIARLLLWTIAGAAALIFFVAAGGWSSLPVRWTDLSGWLSDVTSEDAFIEVVRWLGIAIAAYVTIIAGTGLLAELAAKVRLAPVARVLRSISMRSAAPVLRDRLWRTTTSVAVSASTLTVSTGGMVGAAAPAAPVELAVDVRAGGGVLDGRDFVGFSTEAAAAPTIDSSVPVVVATPGDTLSALAEAHYGYVDDTLLAHVTTVNGITNPDRIAVGQIIAMPPVVSEIPDGAATWSSHQVVQNDTLWDILEAHYGYADADLVWRVAAANGLANPDELAIGQVITLPPVDAVIDTAVVEADNTVVVQIGDSLATIAASRLGDSDRWVEIWEANRGRTMGDGRTFDDPNVIQPDWTLRLPTDTDTPAGDVVPVGGDEPAAVDDGAVESPSVDEQPTVNEPAPEIAEPPTDQVPVTEALPAPPIADDDLATGDVAAADDRPVAASPDLQPASPVAPPTVEVEVDDRETTEQGRNTRSAAPAPAASVDPSTLPVAAVSASDDSIPFSGLIGGVSVAAVIIGLIETARRRRQRSTAPESTADIDTKTNDDYARSELALRALAARSHQHLVAATTVLLSEHYRNAALPVTVLVQSIVVSDDGHITITFDESVPPPAPFTGTDRHWTIAADQLGDVDVEISPEDQLFKTVVSIGRNAASEIFVDLESIGSVTVTGDTESIDSLCRGIRTQLDENIEIVTNADGLDLDDRHQTQPVKDTTLANLGVDRSPLWDAISRGDIHSIIDARLEDWPYEQLVPACVIDPNSDVPASFLADTFGGRGVATITGTPGGAVTWHFDPDGHLSVHDSTSAVENAPVDGEPSIDIATPAVLDTATAAAIDELAQPVEPAPALISIKSVEPVEPSEYQAPPWSYCVRVMRGDLDVIDTNGDVINFVKNKNRNGRRAPELLAFLHQQPDHSASLDKIREALWHDVVFADSGTAPTDDTVRSLMYKARTPIGKDLAVTLNNGNWQLDPDHITTDVTLLRHRAEHVKHNHDDWPQLAELLKGIKGVPFQGSRSWEWAQAFNHFPRVCRDIRVAASIAATAALEASRYDEAMSICDQALLANPCDEHLAQVAYGIDGARGDFDSIRQRHAALVNALSAADGDEPHPSTIERYNQWMSQRRTA